jgi:hypothetical protein
MSPGGLIVKEQVVVIKAGETFPVIEPIDPAGILYDEETGQPVAGWTLYLTDKDDVDLPAVCLGAGEQGQVTGAGGAYAFFLRPGADAACPLTDTVYKLRLVSSIGYQISQNYLPQGGILDADNCTIDAEPETITCEVSNLISTPFDVSDGHPIFFTQFELGAGDPGIFNNHVSLTSTDTTLIPNAANPQGPATPAKPIPTLDEWARILLMLLLGVIGTGYYEREKRRGRVNLR